jgi:hypothetical protein
MCEATDLCLTEEYDDDDDDDDDDVDDVEVVVASMVFIYPCQ